MVLEPPCRRGRIDFDAVVATNQTAHWRRRRAWKDASVAKSAGAGHKRSYRWKPQQSALIGPIASDTSAQTKAPGVPVA
eukprot:3964788-Amphidinium_carterae.2